MNKKFYNIGLLIIVISLLGIVLLRIIYWKNIKEFNAYDLIKHRVESEEIKTRPLTELSESSMFNDKNEIIKNLENDSLFYYDILNQIIDGDSSKMKSDLLNSFSESNSYEEGIIKFFHFIFELSYKKYKTFPLKDNEESTHKSIFFPNKHYSDTIKLDTSKAITLYFYQNHETNILKIQSIKGIEAFLESIGEGD